LIAFPTKLRRICRNFGPSTQISRTEALEQSSDSSKFFCSARTRIIDIASHQFEQVHARDLKDSVACFNPDHIQDIIDQGQQMDSTAIDNAQRFGLLAGTPPSLCIRPEKPRMASTVRSS
jgi:hypothetical protein